MPADAADAAVDPAAADPVSFDPVSFDVVIIGTGSGNSIPTPEFDSLRIAIIERDVFGGTCINRGCVPTKMFVYAADIAMHVRSSGGYGIDATIDKVRWNDIVDRVFSRIDPISPNGKAYRENSPNTTVFTGDARFVGPKLLEVGGRLVTGRHIVVAAGGRPFIPDIRGVDDVALHTSDTIMRITDLPERLIIIGAGYIASEMAHIFGALGSEVVIINRSSRLLANEDLAVSERFTEIYRERFECHMNTRIDGVSEAADGTITVAAHAEGRSFAITGDTLLVAAGRVPNSDDLQVHNAGIAVRPDGYVVTDEFLRTNVEGVWALGDISNDNQLKHVANAEAKAIAHNIIHPDDLRTANLWPIPHAVFADPQVASVGLTEQQLRHDGRRYAAVVQDFGDVAYGWAMEDTQHFCKLIADPDSRLLLGAHIIGPNASMLIQQLVQGIKFGQTVDELASGQLYIHPALSEVVENALLQF